MATPTAPRIALSPAGQAEAASAASAASSRQSSSPQSSSSRSSSSQFSNTQSSSNQFSNTQSSSNQSSSNQSSPRPSLASGAARDAAGGDALATSAMRRFPDHGRESAIRDSQAIRDSNSSGGLHLSPPLERMPVGLAVAIPVRQFRIRNLLAMTPGQLVETQWANGEDLPLSSGVVQLAWSEFEVVDTRLAVRVTRLA